MDAYSIKKVVGEGSFGVALLCSRKSDKMPCIVKRIKLDKMSGKEARQTEQESKVCGEFCLNFQIPKYQHPFHLTRNRRSSLLI